MTADVAGTGERGEQEELPIWGRVIIEWPAPVQAGRALAGWRCKVLDADTGKLITTVRPR